MSPTLGANVQEFSTSEQLQAELSAGADCGPSQGVHDSQFAAISWFGKIPTAPAIPKSASLSTP